MLRSVPGLISLCLGTITLRLPSREASAIWLPLCLTILKPFFPRAFTTSLQETTGSLLLDSYLDQFSLTGNFAQFFYDFQLVRERLEIEPYGLFDVI